MLIVRAGKVASGEGKPLRRKEQNHRAREKGGRREKREKKSNPNGVASSNTCRRVKNSPGGRKQKQRPHILRALGWGKAAKQREKRKSFALSGAGLSMLARKRPKKAGALCRSASFSLEKRQIVFAREQIVEREKKKTPRKKNPQKTTLSRVERGGGNAWECR